MKKTIYINAIMIIVCSCYADIAHSQALIALVFGKKIVSDRVKMGIELGLNESTITNATPWKPRTSFAIGAYSDIQLGKTGGPWALLIYGLFKSSKGADGLDGSQQITPTPDTAVANNSKLTRKMTYFEAVPLIGYRFNSEWYVGYGLDLALRTFAEDQYSAEKEGGEAIYKISTKDQIKRVDVGMALGVQYKMYHGKGLRFSIFYTQGLVNVYNVNEKKGMNCNLHVGVGIPLGS